MGTLTAKPSLENAMGFANIVIINKTPQEDDLDLSLLKPGQALVIFLGENPPLGTVISFCVTRESGPGEEFPLMGKISGYKISKELINELSENENPTSLVGVSCAIVGSCRTRNLKLSFAAMENIFAYKPNIVFKGEKLFLLLRPGAGMEFPLVFPFNVSGWLTPL